MLAKAVQIEEAPECWTRLQNAGQGSKMLAKAVKSDEALEC